MAQGLTLTAVIGRGLWAVVAGLALFATVQSGPSKRDAAAEVVLPADDIESSDPGERIMAESAEVEARKAARDANSIRRERIMQHGDRRYRVVEDWDTSGAQPALLAREIVSADVIMVHAAPGVSAVSLSNSLSARGLQLGQEIYEGLYTAKVSRTDLDAIPAALADLEGDPAIASATVDGVGFGGSAALPDDPIFPSAYNGGYGQWDMQQTNTNRGGIVGIDMAAPEMWDLIQTEVGVKVAVLDTGVKTNQPDLLNIPWVGTNIVSTNANFSDDNGHGTSVAGIIVANRNNGVGIAGLLTGPSMLIVKVLGSNNLGTTSDLIKGLDYARSNGAAVINMSLVDFPYDTNLLSAITRCETSGIVCCISAGNRGSNNDVTPNYPSSYTNANIIAIGNHTRSNTRWNGGTNNYLPSNYGLTNVDLFAPGTDVPAPDLTRTWGDYSWWTGTSQATPHVTAVAAAIKYINPTWTSPQIKASIMAGVVSNTAYATICVSKGRLDAINAIGYAVRQRPKGDNDGDGAGNLLEYCANTRLDSANQCPALTNGFSGGAFTAGMTRTNRPDAYLSLEWNNVVTNSWSTNGITVATNSTNITGTLGTTNTNGFIRARAIPLP